MKSEELCREEFVGELLSGHRLEDFRFYFTSEPFLSDIGALGRTGDAVWINLLDPTRRTMGGSAIGTPMGVRETAPR